MRKDVDRLDRDSNESSLGSEIPRTMWGKRIEEHVAKQRSA